jgi:hypothetical protein
VSERLKELASKASVGETQPWVQIPPSPPDFRLLALRLFLIFLFVTLIATMFESVTTSRAAARWQVITWGPNTPEWNQKLHVTGMRLGCSDSPGSCMKEAGAASREGLEIFLAVPLKVDTAGYGSEYARLSRSTPSVAEIGVDDFTGQYHRLLTSRVSEPATVLNSLIEGVKSDGSQLKFGATIYEDELQLPELSDPKLPAAVRAKFDIVHLYLHYRSNGAMTPEYVEQARKLFPNAKIILGVYAYDRISYIPCRKGVATPCSKQEELDYLAIALDADIALVKAGAASGLEFYPGSFGREDQWSGWDKPDICPARKQECVDNTKELRLLVVREFKKKL